MCRVDDMSCRRNVGRPKVWHPSFVDDKSVDGLSWNRIYMIMTLLYMIMKISHMNDNDTGHWLQKHLNMNVVTEFANITIRQLN